MTELEWIKECLVNEREERQMYEAAYKDLREAALAVVNGNRRTSKALQGLRAVLSGETPEPKSR